MDIRRFIKLIRKDEGSGLILALMTLMVLSILGAALGAITIGSFKLGDINRDDNSAYYIAEAGAQLAYEEFSSDVMSAYDNSSAQSGFFSNISNNTLDLKGKEYSDFSLQFGDQPIAKIDVVEVSEGNPREYKLVSTGIINDKHRTVEMPLKVNWIAKGGGGSLPAMPADVPTLAKSKIELSNGSLIDGDIYFDKEIEHQFINNGTHIGELKEAYILWDQYDEVIANFKGVSDLTYEKKVFVDNSTITVESNTYYPEMNLKKNNYTINTFGKSVYIITDNLTLSNNTNIEIIGEGTVNFLITNSFNSGNSPIINSKNVRNRINILYYGSETLIIPNNSNYNGSLFISQAPLIINNNAVISGVIISGAKEKNVTFAQNTKGNYVLVAPYANVSFENNTVINGSIVADSFLFLNNSELRFEKFDLSDYPFGSVSTDDAISDFPSGTVVGIQDIIKAEPAIEN